MGFEDDLRAFERSTVGRIRKFHRVLAMKVFPRVVVRSPVDKGIFRGNWQFSIGEPANGELETPDKTGSDTISRIRDGVLSWNVDDDHPAFLTNNKPYGPRLEDGWSRQAPAGMVAITIAEFEGLADQVRNQVEGDNDANPEP